jgi:hypothetical protein
LVSWLITLPELLVRVRVSLMGLGAWYSGYCSDTGQLNPYLIFKNKPTVGSGKLRKHT